MGDKKEKIMALKDFQEMEERLSLQYKMLDETATWWKSIMEPYTEEFEKIKENNNFGENESRLDELVQNMRHLWLKAEWEKREQVNFNNKVDKFNALKDKYLYSSLAEKLSSKSSFPTVSGSNNI